MVSEGSRRQSFYPQSLVTSRDGGGGMERQDGVKGASPRFTNGGQQNHSQDSGFPESGESGERHMDVL